MLRAGFESWRGEDSSIATPTQSALRTLEWVGRAENLAVGRAKVDSIASEAVTSTCIPPALAGQGVVPLN